jgi:hypothetical protein
MGFAMPGQSLQQGSLSLPFAANARLKTPKTDDKSLATQSAIVSLN